jgi:phosphoglycolate phosphatase
MYIIDLDGTLLNVWDRYYSVFNDFWRIPDLTLEKYKYFKKKYEFDDLIVKKMLGELDNDKFQEYKAFKRESIESIKYLKLDELIIEKDVFKDFIEKNDLIILTIRNNLENLFWQVNFLGINFVKDKIIAIESKGMFTKKNWVEKNLEKNEKKIVIGDSETDLLVGELENTKVYLVESGLRDPYRIVNKFNIKCNIIPNVNYFLCSDIN